MTVEFPCPRCNPGHHGGLDAAAGRLARREAPVRHVLLVVAVQLAFVVLLLAVLAGLTAVMPTTWVHVR